MKLRLLVMNGQRIVQAEQDGTWVNKKVDRAGLLKPGLYNLHTATRADKAQAHDGTVVFADDTTVYQQKGKAFVAHARADFDKVPEIGRDLRISYGERGKGASVAEAPKLAKSRSRQA